MKQTAKFLLALVVIALSSPNPSFAGKIRAENADLGFFQAKLVGERVEVERCLSENACTNLGSYSREAISKVAKTGEDKLAGKLVVSALAISFFGIPAAIGIGIADRAAGTNIAYPAGSGIAANWIKKSAEGKNTLFTNEDYIKFTGFALRALEKAKQLEGSGNAQVKIQDIGPIKASIARTLEKVKAIEDANREAEQNISGAN